MQSPAVNPQYGAWPSAASACGPLSKRFIVTDTLGLLLNVVVLTAGVQDRDGAKPVLLDTRLRSGQGRKQRIFGAADPEGEEAFAALAGGGAPDARSDG